MTEKKSELTHIDDAGNARMVDVGSKPATERLARARAVVRMKPETMAAIRDETLPKGSVLGVARIAGIGGAKRTSDLIPLCHPLALSQVTVDFEFTSDTELTVLASAKTVGPTGVEMEALSAACVASLTVYDMCKGMDREMVIESVQLIYKSGGKSGVFERDK